MKNAVIGYDLLTKYWDKDYTPEAIRRITKVAFLGKLPCGELNRIQADTVPGNNASVSVVKKVGEKRIVT